MTRSSFFIVAAIVPGLFGLVMMLTPSTMLSNSLALDFDAATEAVTQWVGFAVVSLACINLLSRHDPGSSALNAVMIGNVMFHALGIGFDIFGFGTGIMTTSGLISGLVPHALLLSGFLYYLVKGSRAAQATSGAHVR